MCTALDSLHLSANSLGLKLLGLMSGPRVEWFLADIAGMGSGIATVGLVDTDTVEVIAAKLVQTQLKYVCADYNGFKKIIDAVRTRRSEILLEILVLFDEISVEEAAEVRGLGIRAVYLKEIMQVPPMHYARNVNVKEVCILAYSGGTTGEPKLVKISHETFMESLTSLLFEPYQMHSDDKYILYTNLALYGERLASYFLMIHGIPIGVSKSPELDLKILQPSLMLGVPRVLDYFYNKIQQELSLKPQLSQRLFNKSIQKSLARLKNNKSPSKSIWDTWVLRAVREKFGGKLRIIITGSSLPNQTSLRFLKICLNCDIIEGYGLLEAGYSVFSSGIFNTQGHLGGPLVASSIKMERVPGLHLQGVDPNRCGELYVRNRTANLGYIDGAITDSEGWVRTGDIFKILSENSAFQFVERAVNCFEVKSGWTITPQRLENVFRQCQYVAQIIVCGDRRIDGLVAVVVPNEAFVMKHWGPAGKDFEEICRNPLLNRAILRGLAEVADREGLFKYEFVESVVVEAQTWTDHRFVTGALKIRRWALMEKYRTEINEAIEKIVLRLI